MTALVNISRIRLSGICYFAQRHDDRAYDVASIGLRRRGVPSLRRSNMGARAGPRLLYLGFRRVSAFLWWHPLHWLARVLRHSRLAP